MCSWEAGCREKVEILSNPTAFLQWLTSFSKPLPPQASTTLKAVHQLEIKFQTHEHIEDIPHSDPLKGAETYIYDTHLGLSPIPHIILQSLLPLSFLFLLIFCMVSELPKRSQSRDQSKDVNRCSKAYLVSWSTNPGSGKDSPHALSLSRCPETQMLGCVMDRTLHTCRRQGSEKWRHSINITK